MAQYILIFISETKEYLIRNLSGENTGLHLLIPSKVLHPIFDTTLDILNEQTQHPLLIADYWENLESLLGRFDYHALGFPGPQWEFIADEEQGAT